MRAIQNHADKDTDRNTNFCTYKNTFQVQGLTSLICGCGGVTDISGYSDNGLGYGTLCYLMLHLPCEKTSS